MSRALAELLEGTWRDPESGRLYGIPLKEIRCSQTFLGQSESLLAPLHAGQSLLVVSDAATFEVLGRRVFQELEASSKFPRLGVFVWQTPRASSEGVSEVRAATADFDAVIAVGSGTVSDSVKYATFLDNKSYSVFPTSPMNAYTTSTASIAFQGIKRSLSAHSAKGVFFDTKVVSACPQRLISAAFADVICRTTAQVDWLLSNLILKTTYSSIPYRLLAEGEENLLKNAAALRTGDTNAIATLIQASTIMGLATSFTETTHCGSMAEHGISHYIDTFAGDAHPPTSHGEQVGVATLIVSKMQNRILGAKHPPKLSHDTFPYEEIADLYGEAHAENMRRQSQKKALSPQQIDRLNDAWQRNWEEFVEPLRAVMLPYETLWQAMTEVGAPRNAKELGLETRFYQRAVRHARFLRDRFTILDIAGISGELARLVKEFVLEQDN